MPHDPDPVGAAGPTPIEATATEQMLAGQAPSPELIRHAADAIAEQVDRWSDFRGPADYKRDMAVVFTRRAQCASSAKRTK